MANLSFKNSNQLHSITCDLADKLMQKKLGNNYLDFVTNPFGDSGYTEKGQAIYYDCIDEVESLWAPIAARDDWQPLTEKITAIRTMRAALDGAALSAIPLIGGGAVSAD